MLMDKNIQLSNAQAITSTAVSTNTIDLLLGTAIASSGAYTAQGSTNTIIGNASTFGEDIGLGRGKGTPVFVGNTGGANFGGGTSLQVQVRGAPDNSSGTVGGLSFAVYAQTDTIAQALLVANTNIFTIDWPIRKIGQAMPRFIQLNYVVVGPFNAGTITADLTLGPQAFGGTTLGQYPANY
jgi:hypothetical protein